MQLFYEKYNIWLGSPCKLDDLNLDMDEVTGILGMC